MTSTETTGTVVVDETKRQLGKLFWWRFLSRQRLSFRCRFRSQLGLCALTNPGVSSEAVSFIISKSSAMPFSMTITEATRTVCMDESTLQLCRQSRWLCLRRPLQCFRWRLPCQQRLCARTNPGFSCVGSLVDYFWVVSYPVFGDDYRVNRDCALIRNQVSAG